MDRKHANDDRESYAVIGAALEVHRVLRNGFLEAVYRDALTLELRDRNIPFEREVSLAINYKGTKLYSAYRADFVCWGSLIVECKALRAIGKSEIAQAINSLRSVERDSALLLNFGARSLEFRRVTSSERTTPDRNHGSHEIP